MDLSCSFILHDHFFVWRLLTYFSIFVNEYFIILAPEEPPSDFEAADITSSSIELQWSPPPSHAVPGILRQYNLTYRNLNYTEDHLTELNVNAAVTSHTIDDLIGLTLYEINITSSTIFFGPWDTILVLTEEAGVLFSRRFQLKP